MTDEFDTRVMEWEDDLASAIAGLYPEQCETLAAKLIQRTRESWAARSSDLIELDRRRLAAPDWYQQPERIGYVAYVDRFGRDLDGVRARIPYLTEIGVDVMHLLGLLRPRAGENDGGYAVGDYRAPDPRLGTVDDLERLMDDLRQHGISSCVDLVINHTSDDHEWAIKAQGGSHYHQALYRTYPDRSEPDAFEATLPEVFPQLSPGNFTWNDSLDRWVWTTFRSFQWDLDWSNPDVMIEMFDNALHLANVGVEILRLDAVAFTWKRLGTNCQNQPEAHLVAQSLRAILAMAAPATILLAEAIVGPDDVVGYLGRHELERRECEIAYHNQLMVQSWSMVASCRADLARYALGRLPRPPARATWFTYVRCHDDIGWAIDDHDAAAVGLDAWEHRNFLATFYRGDFWQSFARGAAFASNAETGDERTSGMTASLAGVTAALESGDASELDRAVDRALLLLAIACGFGGIPMIYMGDEFGQMDDLDHLDDPERAADSRWRHRPSFDDALAQQRHDVTSLPGRFWSRTRQLIEARRGCRALHGGSLVEPFDAGADSVFAWHRRHERFGDVIGLANVGDRAASATRWPEGVVPGELTDLLDPDGIDVASLDPLQVRWLIARAGYPTIPPVPPVFRSA